MLIKEHAFYSSNGCCIISQMVRACILVTRNVNAHVCVQVLVYNVVMKLGTVLLFRTFSVECHLT